MTTEVKPDQATIEVKPAGNQQVDAAKDSQPISEVELADGTKVTADELKAGYMKDADYRRKTSELAEERRRLAEDVERVRQFQSAPTQSMRSPLGAQPAWGAPDPDEEVDPIQALAQEVVNLKTAYARDYLTREIDSLAATKYPDMDKKAVFDACWSNPRAVIDGEAERSHNEIVRRVTARTSQVKPLTNLDEFFKASPKAKEEYDRRLIDNYNAKKTQQAKPSTGGGSSSVSGETFHEDEAKPASYSEASKRLRERMLSEEQSF